MAADGATIEAGAKAWARLSRSQRTSWADWIAVARALAIGKASAMKIAQTNRAVGTKYNRIMGQWLRERGFDGINNQERYRALLCLENLPAIEAWRSTLSDELRGRYNHPNCVWYKWHAMAARAVPTAAPPLRHAVISDKPHTKSKSHNGSYGRAVHWPSDALRRAADAIREARSNDVLVLARKALEAAVRSEDDLLALLPAGPPPMEAEALVMAAL
jgi:hypothetical protein